MTSRATHGTVARYGSGCRCDPCRKGSRDYHRQLRKDNFYGRRPARPPAGPVRDHLRNLVDQGMSLRQITAAAGVGIGAGNYVLYGREGNPAVSLPAETADALMAVRLDTGTIYRARERGMCRRVEALMCLGYSITDQAELAGVNRSVLRRVMRGVPIARESRARVRLMYDAHCMHPNDPRGGHEQRVATVARKMATANGYAPPLAWDDIDHDQRPKGAA